MLRWGRTIRWAGYGALAVNVPAIVLASNVTAVQGLVRDNHAVELPGIGRVVLSFLLVVAIGVGILVAIRRYQPRFAQHLSGAGSIRVLDRSRIGQVRVYLLAVDGHKVLLTEHRNSASTLLLEPIETVTDRSQL